MKKSILLVEYDDFTITTIKELLNQPVFEINVANDGEVAKKLLAGRNYDLMITAAMLPRFHGFNLSLAVANEYPNTKIIIISAIYKGLEYKHQAITQYQANDFFEKPLDKEKFRQRVKELLNLSDEDLQESVNRAATTQIPGFDTAKIPTMKKIEEDAQKLTSEDLFSDIIQRVEKVPSYEIKLDGKEQPPARPTPPPAAADAGKTRLMESPPPAAPKPPPPPAPDLTQRVERPAPKPTAAPRPAVDPGKTSVLPEPFSANELAAEKKKSEDKYKKIDDDIARRLEETFSGLGLPRKSPSAKPAEKPVPPAPPPPPPPAPPPPAAKPVERPVPPPPPPPPPPAPPAPPAPAAERKPEPAVARPPQPSVEKPPTAPQEVKPRPVSPPPPPPPMEKPAPRAPEKPAERPTEFRPDRPTIVDEHPNEVGDYVILGLIARGGMAEIYKAKKKGVKGFEKIIAIKRILSGYGEDDKFIEMLVDEAKIAAELSHPNIVQIYDLGRKDNYYFIAMEYVQGKDLREMQRRLVECGQLMPEQIAIHLIIKILEALSYAHKAKDSRGRHLEIVHRDISPPNILVSHFGDVKLTDFGVSKASIKMHQTISGALKGKLLYMSPEQALGEGNVDSRSDLYSVGVILFELLTGKKLFMDTSEMGVLKKVQNGEIIQPREINSAIDPELERIVLRALHKEKHLRYQDATEMVADLEHYIRNRYDYIPGPVHLSHFLYGLFKEDILSEGIKLELKPIPEPPPRRVVETVAPLGEEPEEEERIVEINFDEEIPPVKPEPPAPVKPAVESRPPTPRPAAPPPSPPVKEPVTQQKVLFGEMHEEKKRSPVIFIGIGVAVVMILVLLYFLVLRKGPAPEPAKNTATETPAAAQSAQPAATQPVTTPAQPTTTPQDGKAAPGATTPPQPAATQPAATKPAEGKDAEALKKQQEAEKLKQQQAAEKKKQEEALKKKEEDDRKQREEADRQRLAAEEEKRRQQEEADRKAADEKRRQEEEQKKAMLQQKAVKEGDIVPTAELDAPPEVVSAPPPVINPDLLKNVSSPMVMATLLIGLDGSVESVKLIKKTNIGQVDDLIAAALKKWKYKPLTKGNVRVKTWKPVNVTIKK